MSGVLAESGLVRRVLRELRGLLRGGEGPLSRWDSAGARFRVSQIDPGGPYIRTYVRTYIHTYILTYTGKPLAINNKQVSKYHITLADSLRGSSVRLGTIQTRLAWPLRKDDTHKSRSVKYRITLACLPTVLFVGVIYKQIST